MKYVVVDKVNQSGILNVRDIIQKQRGQFVYTYFDVILLQCGTIFGYVMSMLRINMGKKIKFAIIYKYIMKKSRMSGNIKNVYKLNK